MMRKILDGLNGGDGSGGSKVLLRGDVGGGSGNDPEVNTVNI